MSRFRLIAGLVLIALVAGSGYWAVWNYELRWRPNTIVRHQAEITRILDGSGWVSPTRTGKKLYMISHRTCTSCLRFKTEEFPELREAGADTRVIEIARRDENGLAQSTPAERATVAQLWLTRDDRLRARWEMTPAQAWTAPGLPPADGDAARTAVVEAGRGLVEELTPLLKDNGVKFDYPLLVWWNDKGEMRSCACTAPQTHRFVRKELGG